MFYRVLNIEPYNILRLHVIDYPTPVNINYFWGFGFLAAFCLVIQIVTGICLAMHYVPHVSLAFYSVEHIMRDVNYGWLLRYLHANGASFFFFVVYIHIGKGLYFKSYRNIELWFSGVIIFFLMMGTAFMGYVLPWGQMSFWGATVITSLFSAIPVVGGSLTIWLWGGFSVDNATLVRFFSLHYLLPFLIVGVVISHLALLHTKGSTNPMGIWKHSDYVKLYPYFFIKDFFSITVFLFIFIYFLFFFPNFLGHSDNYIAANPMVTPASIVPEWYFLPFYAILRSIPNKLGGVLFMLLSILFLFLLPFIPNSRISTKFNVYSQVCFWLFVCDVILLGWLGGQAAEEPFILVSRLSTIFYFLYFFSGFFSYLIESLIINSISKNKIKTPSWFNIRIMVHYTYLVFFITWWVFVFIFIWYKIFDVFSSGGFSEMGKRVSFASSVLWNMIILFIIFRFLKKLDSNKDIITSREYDTGSEALDSWYKSMSVEEFRYRLKKGEVMLGESLEVYVFLISGVLSIFFAIIFAPCVENYFGIHTTVEFYEQLHHLPEVLVVETNIVKLEEEEVVTNLINPGIDVYQEIIDLKKLKSGSSSLISEYFKILNKRIK